MTFPTPYPVVHRPYCGFVLDELNNEVPAWEDPVTVRVIGWKKTTAQDFHGEIGRGTQAGDYTSRQISEVLLYTPPGLKVAVRDRFTVDDADYEVDEVRDISHGFHGWKPGGVAKLTRIAPKGRP